jgi:hypothetical protein
VSELGFIYLFWSALQDGGGPTTVPLPASPGSHAASMIVGGLMGLLVAWAFRREVCGVGARLGTRLAERTGDWIVRRRA